MSREQRLTLHLVQPITVNHYSVVVVSLAATLLSLPANAADSVSWIQLTQSGCFGTCPSYTVTIFGSGQVKFVGHSFVKARGIRLKRIPQSQWVELAARVDQIGFFGFKALYRPEPAVTDVPFTTIVVYRGSVTKEVQAYGLAPKGFYELQAQIERVANVSNWVKLDEKAKVKEWERAYR